MKNFLPAYWSLSLVQCSTNVQHKVTLFWIGLLYFYFHFNSIRMLKLRDKHWRNGKKGKEYHICKWQQFAGFSTLTIYYFRNLIIRFPKSMKSERAFELNIPAQITYSWFIMGLKSEGNCGLWFFNKIMIKICTESLKKIVGAVWEIPAK